LFTYKSVPVTFEPPCIYSKYIICLWLEYGRSEYYTRMYGMENFTFHFHRSSSFWDRHTYTYDLSSMFYSFFLFCLKDSY